MKDLPWGILNMLPTKGVVASSGLVNGRPSQRIPYSLLSSGSSRIEPEDEIADDEKGES